MSEGGFMVEVYIAFFLNVLFSLYLHCTATLSNERSLYACNSMSQCPFFGFVVWQEELHGQRHCIFARLYKNRHRSNR